MGKKILVADDEQEICDLLQMLLSREGYDVVCVDDGQKAYEKMNKEYFDLVILDVMMPQMDGYHLAYKISTQMSGPIPKILIISSRDAEQDQHLGEKSGAVAHIRKPIDSDQLLAKIKEVIGTA